MDGQSGVKSRVARDYKTAVTYEVIHKRKKERFALGAERECGGGNTLAFELITVIIVKLQTADFILS